MVIDGIPCDTTSYQIVSCISLATQDDVFLELSDLVVGKEYLLNIDGYLHDFCDFEIEFGTENKGLPMVSSHKNILSYTRKDQYVYLDWEIEPSIEANIIEYQIFRRESRETRHSLVQVLSHEKNAFGISQLSYSTQDTVQSSGRYYYKMVTVLNNYMPIILDEIELRIMLKRDLTEGIIELELDYEKSTQLSILVFNAENGSLLENYLFDFSDKYRRFPIEVHKWTMQNVHQFRVDIVNNNTDEKEVLTFNR